MTPARAILAVMFKEARSHPELPRLAGTESADGAHETDNSHHGLDVVTSSGGLSSGTDTLAPCFQRTQQE